MGAGPADCARGRGGRGGGGGGESTLRRDAGLLVARDQDTRPARQPMGGPRIDVIF